MDGRLATLFIAIAVLFLAMAAAKATRVMAAHRERLDALERREDTDLEKSSSRETIRYVSLGRGAECRSRRHALRRR